MTDLFIGPLVTAVFEAVEEVTGRSAKVSIEREWRTTFKVTAWITDESRILSNTLMIDLANDPEKIPVMAELMAAEIEKSLGTQRV